MPYRIMTYHTIPYHITLQQYFHRLASWPASQPASRQTGSPLPELLPDPRGGRRGLLRQEDRQRPGRALQPLPRAAVLR